MMSLGIRRLEEEISMLKNDLTTAVAMIEMLSLAVLKYRHFVLFNCKCDSQDKQLLTTEDRFEQLAKACQFALEENGLEKDPEHGEKLDDEWSSGNFSDDEDEPSAENANTFQENGAEEESLYKVEPENNKLTEDPTRNEVNSAIKPDETAQTVIPVSLYNKDKKERIKWKQYKNEWHEDVETDSGKKFKCLECKRLYSTFGNFKSHYQTTHHLSLGSYNGQYQDFIDSSGEKRFQCLKCPKVLKSYSSMRKHYKNMHVLGPQKCPHEDCDRTFKQRQTLLTHYKEEHGDVEKILIRKKSKDTGPFACDWPGCEHVATKKCNLKQHRLLHDGEKKFICDWPGCDFRAKFKGSVVEHAKRHGQQPQLNCHWPGCSRLFYNEAEIRKHVRLNHLREKKFKCDWPNCEYRARSNLIIKNHMVKHTQERKWACSWPGCDKKYLSRSNLDTHMVVHKGIRPFRCQVEGCTSDFNLASTLRTHVKLVHEKVKLKK